MSARTRVTDGAPAGWDELLATDPNATPAHRTELWSIAGATHPGTRPAWVAVEQDGTLIGGMPLIVERRGGHHWLVSLPFLLSGTPLARPGAHAVVDAACGVAVGRLQRDLRAVGGEWSLYRPCGPDPLAGALEGACGETRMLETSVLDLADGLEAAWRRIADDLRVELRRARGGLAIAEDPGALEECYALHLAQARGWPGYRPAPLELLRRLLVTPAVGGGGPIARLHAARDTGGLVAAMFLLDHPREAFGWWTCARGGARARHAIPALVWSVAEWAAAAGRSRLNLGGSVGRSTLTAFKQPLGGRVCRYPVRWLEAARGPSTARLLALLQRHGRGGFRGDPR